MPGTVALANESHQNSTALKNITIHTGSATFNTAIEYDTDQNHYAYSRIKHYIVNGKAYSYEYDDAGNISKIQSPDGTWVTYEYDSLNQLKKETYSSCLPLSGEVDSAQAEDGGVVSYDTITYTYDTRGNLLTKTYSLGETVVADNQYTYADTTWKDRLTEYNDVEIGYDQIGNPKNWIDGSALAWQKGRQLASYTKDGVETAFTYDVDGIRRSKTTNGVKTEYNVYDGQLRSLTLGDNTMRFVYGNGLSSVIFNDTEYWYVFNAQGDVLGLIDASGSYVVQYTYDAWGKITSQTESDLAKLNPFRYRGYIYDEETGLYYCQARYYAPEVGRWLNADNMTDGGAEHLGYNLFIYTANNPLNNSDITGQWIIKDSIKWLTKNVLKPATDYVKSVTSKLSGTDSVGLSLNATCGIGLDISIGGAADFKGNIGVIVTGGVIGGTPAAGVNMYNSVSTAPEIEKLEGIGIPVGGSVDLNGVSAGAEYALIPDFDDNEFYHSGSLYAGIGAPIPLEFHTGVTYSYVWSINVYEVLETLYIAIMEW